MSVDDVWAHGYVPLHHIDHSRCVRQALFAEVRTAGANASRAARQGARLVSGSPGQELAVPIHDIVGIAILALITIAIAIEHDPGFFEVVEKIMELFTGHGAENKHDIGARQGLGERHGPRRGG